MTKNDLHFQEKEPEVDFKRIIDNALTSTLSIDDQIRNLKEGFRLAQRIKDSEQQTEILLMVCGIFIHICGPYSKCFWFSVL